MAIGPLLAGAAVGLLGFGAAMAVVAVAVAAGAAVAVPRFPALAADAAGTP